MPTAQSMPANAGCKMNLGPGDAKVVRPTADDGPRFAQGSSISAVFGVIRARNLEAQTALGDDPARKAIRLRRDIDRFNRHAPCLYPRHANTFAKLNAVMREYCCR